MTFLVQNTNIIDKDKQVKSIDYTSKTYAFFSAKYCYIFYEVFTV